MATRLDCHKAWSGVPDCSPSREWDHDSRNSRLRILDFQQIAKTSWGEHSAVAKMGPGGAPTKIRDQVTTFARRSEIVARPGDPPQSEYAGLPCVPARSGAASGKESPMGKRCRQVIADESHESAKKNLTRQRRHTLRSHPSSENAGTQRAFILIHGATDASGR